jgi:hypothetical protein
VAVAVAAMATTTRMMTTSTAGLALPSIYLRGLCCGLAARLMRRPVYV